MGANNHSNTILVVPYATAILEVHLLIPFDTCNNIKCMVCVWSCRAVWSKALVLHIHELNMKIL